MWRSILTVALLGCGAASDPVLGIYDAEFTQRTSGDCASAGEEDGTFTSDVWVDAETGGRVRMLFPFQEGACDVQSRFDCAMDSSETLMTDRAADGWARGRFIDGGLTGKYSLDYTDGCHVEGEFDAVLVDEGDPS